MRDWLICGHVALDKCNVSQVNNCCPPENKMAALNLQVYKCFFQVYLKTTESKRDEKYTADNTNAVEIL